MNKLAILLLAILSLNGIVSIAQTTQYKTYTNAKDKFSFDIPSYWSVKFSKAEYGLVCTPITNAEIKVYKNCFEGIVFRMFVYNTPLDATLANDGYTKSGITYSTTYKFNKNVKADNIKGNNWTGIYHLNECGIQCKINVSPAVAGKCEFIYFSNGKTTVSITTNGKQFKKEVLERLKSSFRFN